MEARIKMLENSVRVLQEVNVQQDRDALKDLLTVALTIKKLERRIARLEGLAGDGEKFEDSGGKPPSLGDYLASLMKDMQS